MKLHYYEWYFEFNPKNFWVGLCWQSYPKAIAFRINPLPMCQLYLYVQWH